MSGPKKIITYTCSKCSQEHVQNLCTQLSNDLPVKFESVKNIQEFFPLLSQPGFISDFIVLDVDQLYAVDGIDAFDILRTLSTLISCTVCRDEKSSIKPSKRSTKIVALVSEFTDSKILQQIIAMPEVDYLSLRSGPSVTYAMVRDSVNNYISYGERTPKYILDLIRHKKQERKEPTNEINLTGRQEQILNIITSRGASNKHIAKMLSISESTVKLHVGSILKKYGLKNRTQLALFAKKPISHESTCTPKV
jgi:DNA-binding NarL/FixJ family response regulator